MSLPIFAYRLKELMLLNGLNNHKLSKEISVQRKSIINWLGGVNYPRYDAFIKLANYLNVSTDYLVGLTDDCGEEKYFSKIPIASVQTWLIEKLNDYMVAEGITKYALAKRLKMEQSTVERWFKKGAMPEIFVLIRISERMNYSHYCTAKKFQI